MSPEQRRFSQETEPSKSPESGENMGFGEALFRVGIFGLKALVFCDKKREGIRKIVDEAGQDIRTQPGAAKEIAGSSIARLGGLALEYQREQQEASFRQRLVPWRHPRQRSATRRR